VSELGALQTVASLRQGLQASEPVRYRDGGNRSTDGTELLERLEQLMPSLGVTRLAEISQLAPGSFPVFQSCRPNLYTHVACGQNTGAQGKGRSRLQAQLSCMMEEVESYCCEPKNVQLIRGGYRFLSGHYVTAYPRKLTHNYQLTKATTRAPLMWIRGYSMEQDCELLLPAETVLLPFCPQDYDTDSFFPCSSNGLAAGATFLEAVVHGLYEVIERSYLAMAEAGEALVDRIPLATAGSSEHEALLGGGQSSGKLELESVRFDGLAHNLPMIIGHLRHGGTTYGGYGCSANLAQACDRAISEALQALAVDISGSREDLDTKRGPAGRGPARRDGPLLEPDQARSLWEDRQFSDLRNELDYLIGMVHELGHQNIFVANLTRVGIDIPVVKVVVPALPCPMAQREEWTEPLTYSRRMAHRYGLPKDRQKVEREP
jgi:YcaO-like protein with predicted kinase domain